MIASLAVFIVCLDLLSSIVIRSHNAFPFNESRFTVSIVMENLLEELNPKTYQFSDLKAAIEDEAKLNELTKKRISWELTEKDNKAYLKFTYRKKTIFSTELQLP
jgi:hypothetical protein